MKTLGMLGASLPALAMVGGLCLAQDPAGPPGPGPEHKRMERFVGTWTGKADMKASPFGPAGVMTWTEACEWFAGGFSIVCKSEGKGPMGPMKGLSVLSYSPEERLYSFYGVDSTGWTDLSKGTVKDGVWTFESHGTMGGQPMHGRMTVTEVSAAKQTFTWALSQDGKTWNVMMEGGSSK